MPLESPIRKAWMGVVVLALAVVSGGCQTVGWRQKLAEDLPVMGHRNWIVVADSAYPAQTAAGIETIATGASQIDTVKDVLAALDDAPHVQPVVYLDAELKHVSDQDAPGIDAYRAELKRALANRRVNSLPHEEIIAKLDEAGKTFRVLIFKTTLTLPYTSVFLQLDCGYWGPDAERKLRETIKAQD